MEQIKQNDNDHLKQGVVLITKQKKKKKYTKM